MYEIRVYSKYDHGAKRRFYYICAVDPSDDDNLEPRVRDLILSIIGQQYFVWLNLHENNDDDLFNINDQRTQDDIMIKGLRNICNVIRQAEKEPPLTAAENENEVYGEFLERMKDTIQPWQFIQMRSLLEWHERFDTGDGARGVIKIAPLVATQAEAGIIMFKQCIKYLPSCHEFRQVCCSVFEYSVPRDDILREVYKKAPVCFRCGHATKHSPAKCTRKDIRCLARTTAFNVSCSVCGLLTHPAEKCTVTKQMKYSAFNTDDYESDG